MNESKNDVLTRKIIAGLLLLIPAAVFSLTPLYNSASPSLDLLGLTFFYWFPIAWLFVSALAYVIAATILNKLEAEGKI